MFEHFSERARRVVVLSREEARLLGHDYIGAEHILLGLIHEDEGMAGLVLTSFGVTLEAGRTEVARGAGRGGGPSSGHIPFTEEAKTVLQRASHEARRLGRREVATEHLLVGLIGEGDRVAAQLLVKLGVDLGELRERLATNSGGSATKPKPKR